MKTMSLGGVVTIVVEDEDTEQEILEFIASLRTEHPPYPFGFIAFVGSTVVFENDEQLEEFIEGWVDGIAVEA